MMASDWVKMRTDLYRDPKVCVIADILLGKDSDLARYINQHTQRDCNVTRNVMRNATVGALVSIWGVLRQRGKRIDDDLVANGCAASILDDIADMPGFGDAMIAVGWAEETATGIVLPRFFADYNVDPGDETKNKNTERQRRWRDQKKEENNVTRNVTVALENNAREEKRREEKEHPLVLSLPAEDGSAKIDSLPDCPHQDLIALYGEILPELPQPRIWEGANQTAMRARWRWVLDDLKTKGKPHDVAAGVDFFRRLFSYVKQSDFLCGRGAAWAGADLGWIIKGANFAKILQGNYENKAAA